MGTFLVFILKSSACLILFYLLYKLVLSRNTFHKANRCILIGIYTLVLLLPLVEMKTEQPTGIHYTIHEWEQIMLTTENTGDEASYANTDTEKAPFSPAWTDIVLLVYCAGILFFVLKSIYSFIRIGILLRHGKCEKLYGKVKLVTHSCNIAPFSWMNYIVIPEADMKENGEVILMHEFAHIRHHHSFDLFVAELFAFFQWFNPAAWLMKRELQNVHEYQADNTVINMGVDAKEYQLLLIRKAVGTQRFYSMTHSFNHCKLKSRINMMLKQKSKSWMRLKYLTVLPLSALALVAFAHPEVVERMDELSVVRISDQTPIVISTMEEVRDTVVAKAAKPVPAKVAEKQLPYQELNREQLVEKLKAINPKRYQEYSSKTIEFTEDYLRYAVKSQELHNKYMTISLLQTDMINATGIGRCEEYNKFMKDWMEQKKKNPNYKENFWTALLIYAENNDISEDLKNKIEEVKKVRIEYDDSKSKKELEEFIGYWKPSLTNIGLKKEYRIIRKEPQTK